MTYNQPYADKRTGPGRRPVPGLIFLVLIVVTAVYCKRPRPAIAARSESPLEKLLAGNERFSNQHSIHPDEDLQHLKEAAKGQHPFAAVICCSDSRVAPELVFDQGIGDLFVIRTAGNIISGVELGSIEYAIEHLHVPLILVLGHENCGAIKAFIDNDNAPGHIKDIIDSLQEEHEIQTVPANDANRVDAYVRANVAHGITKLRNESALIKEKLATNQITIVGALYDLDDFKVSVIPVNN